MEIKQYQAAVEAVLFASGEPIAASRWRRCLNWMRKLPSGWPTT